MSVPTPQQSTGTIAFTKMQGVGNDFIVVDGRGYAYRDWSVLAMEMCDRNFGIGADGLLVIDVSHIADFMMRMYNPDGTPDVCGNGLRCVARYAVEHGIIASDTMRIGTLAGARQATIVRNADGAYAYVTVEMGTPKFDPLSIPAHEVSEDIYDYPLDIDPDSTLVITALSTGTAHAVTFVNELPEDSVFLDVSAQVENHPLFPDRTSVMWCKVESSDRLSLRIWERGVGETWGCGTGACAAVVAAILHGYTPPSCPVTVASKGGELQVSWCSGEQIHMAGPAEYVYKGTYFLDAARPTSY